MAPGPEGTVYTLELIADSLRGPASFLASVAAAVGLEPEPGVAANQEHTSPSVLAAKGLVKPALGLRILDLPHVVLEAPEDEVYATAASSCCGEVADGGEETELCLSFGGRGKALMFELLEDSREPLPFWLMALAMCPDQAAACAAGTDAPRPVAAAVLLASACVDLQAEVSIVREGARSAEGGACAFRRCTFRMSAVRDTGCSLTLDCFFRIYTGTHRPLVGGELLLEPALVQPPQTPYVAHSSTPKKKMTKKKKQPTVGKVAARKLEGEEATIGRGPASSPARATASVEEGSTLASGPLPGHSELRRSWRRPPAAARDAEGAFFPGEIVFGGSSG